MHQRNIRKVVDWIVTENLQQCAGEVAMAITLVRRLLAPASSHKNMRFIVLAREPACNSSTPEPADISTGVFQDETITVRRYCRRIGNKTFSYTSRLACGTGSAATVKNYGLYLSSIISICFQAVDRRGKGALFTILSPFAADSLFSNAAMVRSAMPSTLSSDPSKGIPMSAGHNISII